MDGFLKDGGTPQDALKNVAGVQFTVISGILLASTFIPAGAFALNPRLLFGEDLSGSLETVVEKQDVELASFDERTDVPVAAAEAAHASY